MASRMISHDLCQKLSSNLNGVEKEKLNLASLPYHKLSQSPEFREFFRIYQQRGRQLLHVEISRTNFANQNVCSVPKLPNWIQISTRKCPSLMPERLTSKSKKGNEVYIMTRKVLPSHMTLIKCKLLVVALNSPKQKFP